MSEFNGKQFYGFSMQNNPNLSTTTKNLEFQYLHPEYRERTMQKSQRKQEIKEKPPTSHNFCRRAATPELQPQHGILRRDPDVKTHMAADKLTCQETQTIRELSEQEIDSIITKVKTHNHNSPRTRNTFCENFQSLTEGHHSPRSHQKANTNFVQTSALISPNSRNCGILRMMPQDETFVLSADLNQTYNVQTSTCTNQTNNRPIQVVDYMEPTPQPAQVPQIIDHVRIEDYRQPQAKWVEILETNKETRSEIEVPRSPVQPHCGGYEYYGTPRDSQQSMQHHMPAMLMTEVIAENVRAAGSYINVNPYGDIQTTDTYIVEESDLEFEMIDREHYSKYIKSKPLPEELLDLSMDDEGSLAEFIAIESGLREMDVTYLRNTSPLRYTEITEDTQDEQSRMKIYINGREKKPNRMHQEKLAQSPSDPEPFETLPTSDRCSPSKSLQQNKHKTKTLREQHLQRTFERLAGGGSKRSTTPCTRGGLTDNIQSNRSYGTRTNGASSPQRQTEVVSCSSSRMVDKNPKRIGRRVMPKKLRISPSIEFLKSEKSNIFQKMSETQEKIIEVLDKLRMTLLELNVPENSFEKSKRQRNAFEFAVRFSRNFLYPLKGMLDDIKCTPIEQFNSLTSNEACRRVCNMYALLLQSLNTYQKQLRYFLLDHVPQKLPILIEMMYAATSLCLEKQIFSRHDVIVDCLQERCTKFLEFLQDLQDGRLNTAQENYRKLTMDKASPKYDLKMFMNDLNMYEPKLVPKVATTRKKAKPKRHIASVAIEEVKDTIREKPKDDSIPTHIQNMPMDNKSSTQFNVGSGDAAVPGLDKTILEALQNVTKEQVRKVLEPILASLGTALGKQNNPVAVEAIVSALQSKVFSTMVAEQQLNNDNKCSQEKKAVAEVSSVDSLGGSTCKPLKAAKQTKTQRQQNNCCGGEAAAAVLTSKKRFDVVAADDDSTNNNINNDSNNNDNNDHTKSYANSLSQSNSRHSITQRRVVVVDGGIGETDHKQQQRGETRPPTTTTDAAAAMVRQREESNINKSTKKLMNEVRSEDQIDEELTPEDMAQKQQQQRRRRHQQNHQQQQQLRQSAERAHRHSKQLHRRAQQTDQHVQRRQHDSSCSSTTSSASHYSHHHHSSSTSDSEGGHNPKLKKHLRSQYYSTTAIPTASPTTTTATQQHRPHHPNIQNTNLLLGVSRSGQQPRRSSSHSQCQLLTQTVSRNATATTTSSTISQQCLTSTNAKRNIQHQKRDLLHIAPPPPPATPSVTPSSSGHLSDNGSRETQDHDDDDDDNVKLSHKDDMMLLLQMPMDEELKVPLTANVTDLTTLRNERISSHERAVATRSESEKDDAEIVYVADRANHKIVRTASGTSYVELYRNNTQPLYTNNSPYNTPRRLRPLPAKELQNLKPKPLPNTTKKKPQVSSGNHSTSMKENLNPRNEEDQTAKKQDLRFDDMIRERNRFLELCEKNRFYRNPNYTEPWNVFSTISERLLNEVLDTVENDFTAGVSKFVEDFLELETRTQW